MRTRFGGWLQNVAAFDGTLFSIALPEAELMDPQQRLLLETACQLLQVGLTASSHTASMPVLRLGRALCRISSFCMLS